MQTWLPTINDFEGVSILVYVLVAWGIVPASILGLLLFEKTKAIGLVLGFFFVLFALSRLHEAFAIFIVFPAMATAGFARGVIQHTIGNDK